MILSEVAAVHHRCLGRRYWINEGNRAEASFGVCCVLDMICLGVGAGGVWEVSGCRAKRVDDILGCLGSVWVLGVERSEWMIFLCQAVPQKRDEEVFWGTGRGSFPRFRPEASEPFATGDFSPILKHSSQLL